MEARKSPFDCKPDPTRVIPVDRQRSVSALIEAGYLCEWRGPKGFHNSFYLNTPDSRFQPFRYFNL